MKARHLLALSLTLATTPAVAQDVVVMRRTVTKSNFGEHHWQVGTYRSNGPACSDKAPATTTVSCVRNDTGAVAGDGNCQGQKPSTTGTTEDYRTCTYRWESVAFGNWAEACSDATYRTRAAAACQRVGGAAIVPVATTFCTSAGAAPSVREDGANYSGCTYTWAVKTSVCDGSGSRDITYQCERTGGSTAKAVLTTAGDVANCGTKPAGRVADNSCGSPNLVVNGGFEDGLTPWTTVGQGRVVPASEQAYNGRTGSGANAFQFIQGTSLDQVLSNLVEGRTYTVTFKASAGYDTLSVNITGPGSSRRIWSVKPGTPWAEYTADFTAGYNDRNLQFASSNLAYIDDVTIKQK